MKKLLIALALGIVLVLALATAASADNGPHGGFTATTDACANCHRAHTAQYGSNSLLIMDPEALCLSCHDGLGAGTNVEDGVYMQSGSDAHAGGAGLGPVEGVDNASLFGGGFTNALMATVWSGAKTADPAYDAASAAVTSAHDMGASGTVWGSGAVNTGNGGSMVLECTSCHDPHGNAGWVTDGNTANNTDTRTSSYRLLRWQPSGSAGFSAPATAVNWSGGAFPISDMGSASGTDTSGWTVPDNFAVNGTEWYTLGTQTLGATPAGPFAAGDYMNGNVNNVYQPFNTVTAATQNYIPAAVNTAYFCAQCHDRYFNNSRLRNNTDVSMYCGHPLNATTPPYTGSPLFLPLMADVDGIAPYVHPVDPVRCEPVVSTTTGLITGWGDNGDSGDNTFMYRHASGDIRLSSDGANAAGAGTSVSRSCVACHVSHGTSAGMTTLASDASLATGSTLLRMDNRSICLRCHASSVNFTVAP